MGNRSSGPSQEDYKAYVQDLLELQKFLNEKFVAGHLRSTVVDHEFDTEYLDALKIKLHQLQNVRRHVRSLSGRRANDVPPMLKRLLDALEPQCQKAVDELTSLQAQQYSLMSTASSQQHHDILPDTAADEGNPHSGVHPPTALDGKCSMNELK